MSQAHSENPGRRSGLVSHVDIAKTILEAAGSPRAPEFEGVSLLPMCREPAARVRDAAMSHVVSKRVKLVSRYEERYHLIYDYSRNRDELYDLLSDPGQTRNLAVIEQEQTLRMRGQLLEWGGKELTALAAESAGDPGEQVILDEETKKRLESLGYVVQ